MCFSDRLLLLFRVNGFRGAGLSKSLPCRASAVGFQRSQLRPPRIPRTRAAVVGALLLSMRIHFLRMAAIARALLWGGLGAGPSCGGLGTGGLGTGNPLSPDTPARLFFLFFSHFRPLRLAWRYAQKTTPRASCLGTDTFRALFVMYEEGEADRSGHEETAGVVFTHSKVPQTCTLPDARLKSACPWCLTSTPLANTSIFIPTSTRSLPMAYSPRTAKSTPCLAPARKERPRGF